MYKSKREIFRERVWNTNEFLVTIIDAMDISNFGPEFNPDRQALDRVINLLVRMSVADAKGEITFLDPAMVTHAP